MRERSSVGAVRNLIEPGGNFVMPIRSREIVIAIVALKDVCDWLIAQDRFCSLPKTGTQPQIQSRRGVRTLKECSPSPIAGAMLCIHSQGLPGYFIRGTSRNNRIPRSPLFLLFVPLLTSPELPKTHLFRNRTLPRREGMGGHYRRLFE